ncbi:MAG TPA: methyltransferase domain-containing protein [Mariprofundaceae bacterium]|nr:methyltransferase domain-containing protein [Mariprofundaceae bacterium]
MPTTSNYEAARHNMVEYQIRCCKVLEPELLDMIESLPREEYLPKQLQSLAYMEGHVPLPCNQEMLSPLQEASIVQSLNLTGTERVLEIGTGTGFLTTMLAMRSAEVISCELHEELASLGRINLQAHGVSNATVVHVNAMDSEELATSGISGPFDVIVITAALNEIPDHIKALLTKSGQMVAFIGTNPVVSLVHLDFNGVSCTRTALFETLLQDMEGLPTTREFIF